MIRSDKAQLDAGSASGAEAVVSENLAPSNGIHHRRDVSQTAANNSSLSLRRQAARTASPRYDGRQTATERFSRVRPARLHRRC